jgi:hypothetical protein
MKKFMFLVSALALSACVLACVQKEEVSHATSTQVDTSTSTAGAVGQAVEQEVKSSN